MARVIQKTGGRDVLETVKWQEFVVIYVHSVIVNLFIVLKNVLLSVRSYFESWLSPTRRLIAHKFPALSLIGKGESKTSKLQRSVACPHQLMDSQLGNHKFMKLKTTKLHYVESGAESDHVVLLLHGFPDCFFGWRYQIPVLARYHRVIALDLKGFSDSDKPVLRHNYRPSKICAELKDFLDALGIKSVTIIGHDLGGLIAWIFALKFPDYVNRLITISAPHPNLYWQPLQTALITRKWSTMVQMPFLPENELNKSCSFIEKFYHHLRREGATMEMEDGTRLGGKEQLETYKYIFNSSLDWTGPLNYFRNFMFYRVKANLSVECPCVIISGNEDPNYKLETVIKGAEFCDNPVIRIIEGAGHFPHQSHSSHVNTVLLKHLGSAKRKKEVEEEGVAAHRGIVGRMINKMYGVGQHYGVPNLTAVNDKIFNGLVT